MREDRFIIRRVAGIVLIVLTTLLFSLLMGSKTGIALDEMLVLFFLDFIFLAVFIYFLEEERIGKHLPKRESNDFRMIAVVYLLGLVGTYLGTWLPEYASIAFCFAIAMVFVSNRDTALITGIYLSLILAFVLNQDIHVLTAEILSLIHI